MTGSLWAYPFPSDSDLLDQIIDGLPASLLPDLYPNFGAGWVLDLPTVAAVFVRLASRGTMHGFPGLTKRQCYVPPSLKQEISGLLIDAGLAVGSWTPLISIWTADQALKDQWDVVALPLIRNWKMKLGTGSSRATFHGHFRLL